MIHLTPEEEVLVIFGRGVLERGIEDSSLKSGPHGQEISSRGFLPDALADSFLLARFGILRVASRVPGVDPDGGRRINVGFPHRHARESDGPCNTTRYIGDGDSALHSIHPLVAASIRAGRLALRPWSWTSTYGD